MCWAGGRAGCQVEGETHVPTPGPTHQLVQLPHCQVQLHQGMEVGREPTLVRHSYTKTCSKEGMCIKKQDFHLKQNEIFFLIDNILTFRII